MYLNIRMLILPSNNSMEQTKYIVLYDAQCNFCNYWVRYIIKRDRKDVFRFSALSSNTGKTLLQQYQINPKIDTVVLIKNGSYFTKSTAALHIMKTLGGLSSILFPWILLPVAFRDFIYDRIAKYRYHWFGKSDCVIIPPQKIKHKFLDL